MLLVVCISVVGPTEEYLNEMGSPLKYRHHHHHHHHVIVVVVFCHHWPKEELLIGFEVFLSSLMFQSNLYLNLKGNYTAYPKITVI